ncbi:hypothetical protein CW304_25420 [Bacillus sp. UFRGS-B20]|nr:hypothetical protein CW304_25420 [Bacillus sp. UFRGS-B20]
MIIYDFLRFIFPSLCNGVIFRFWFFRSLISSTMPYLMIPSPLPFLLHLYLKDNTSFFHIRILSYSQ